MKKISIISKVAAAAILGTVFLTGCGGGGGSSSTADGIQATDGYIGGSGRVMLGGTAEDNVTTTGKGFMSFKGSSAGKEIIIKGLYTLSMEDLKFLSHEFVDRGAKFVYIFNHEGGIINKAPEHPINLSTIFKELKERFNVKGGGRDFISIKTDKTLEIGDYLWSIVKSQ